MRLLGALLIASLSVACIGTLEAPEGDPSGQDGAVGGTIIDADLGGDSDAATGGDAAPSTERLTVSFDTTANGGNYAPKNVVAVWIEGTGGAFVKTVGRWAATRKQHLVAWNQKAGTNDVDAVSGATRPDHTNRLTITWDLKNKAGQVVPDGTYTIRMELADSNATQTTQNRQGTFTFDKNGTAATRNVSGGGFNAVTVDYSGR